MVKITACVIVKNEEKNIVQWITSMKKITKDLVVVDTGSTDQTVQKAKSFGAKVYTYAWDDDFAAAKNFAIEQANGEWIIFLDADEYFTDESMRNVRKTIEKIHHNQKVDALICKIINVDADQNQRYISEFFNLRIFRNDSMLRYQRPIHETMGRKNGSLGFFVIPEGVEIYHSGYSSSIITEKFKRNLKMLQEEITKVGEKPWHYRYLCDCFFGLENYEKAYYYARLHVEKGERSLGRDNFTHKRLLESMMLLKKPAEEVLAEINKMLEAYPGDGEILWYKGIYLLERKFYHEAEMSFKEMIYQSEHMSPDNGDYSYTSLNGRWGSIFSALGLIAEFRGDIKDAFHYYQAGLEKFKYNESLLTMLVALNNRFPRIDLLAYLKGYYQENQTDACFVLRVLNKFPRTSAYAHYKYVSSRYISGQNGEFVIEDLLAGGDYALAVRSLKKELKSDYVDWTRLVLENPAVIEKAFEALLPPVYKAAYLYCRGEKVDLTLQERQLAIQIKGGATKDEMQDGDLAEEQDDYQLCLRHMEKQEYLPAMSVAARILEKDPQNGDILYIVAYASYQTKDLALAENAAQAALTNKTKYDAETFKLLGHICYQKSDFLGVIHFFRQALRCINGTENDFSASLAQGLGHAYRVLGEGDKAKEYYLSASAWSVNEKERLENYSSYLLCCHYRLTMSEEDIFIAHRKYQNLLKKIKPYNSFSKKNGKIRIGYLSADFRQHVLYCFYYALLASYDRNSFTVVCYSIGEEDAETEKLKRGVDEWRYMGGRTYNEIAAMIHEDAIDILVELGGHSANSGLPVLAFKPSPVQICGLGYFNTTGLDTVDYFLSDVHADPVGENDGFFTEKLIRLPHSQLCYTPAEGLPEPSTSPCMRKNHITFGSFNQYVKITDEMLKLWREILARVPNSVLVLKAQLLGYEGGKDIVLDRLRGLGFDMEQVVLEAVTADYMDRYLDIDIALDSYPYPGGGTTCDALYMGVPVIVLKGKRHGARLGYSILKNVGLEELAASNEQEYIDRALGLANDKDLLNLLHKNLRGMMRKSPLMDQKGYMAELEQTYKQMIKRKSVSG